MSSLRGASPLATAPFNLMVWIPASIDEGEASRPEDLRSNSDGNLWRLVVGGWWLVQGLRSHSLMHQPSYCIPDIPFLSPRVSLHPLSMRTQTRRSMGISVAILTKMKYAVLVDLGGQALRQGGWQRAILMITS